MRMFLTIIAMLIVFGGGGVYGYHFAKRRIKATPVVVPKNKKEISTSQPRLVACLGRIKPQSDTVIGGRGRIVKLLVSEGKTVKTGEIIAYLESYKMHLQERKHVASLLQENKNRLTAEVAYANSLLNEAEVSLEKLKNIGKIQLEAQQVQIQLAKEDLKFAEQELRRLKAMGEDEVSLKNLEEQVHVVAKQKGKLQHANVTLAQMELDQKMNIALSQAQVQTAHKRILQIKSNIPITSLQQRLQVVKQQMENQVIRSPANGRILKIFTHEGENIGSSGVCRMGNTKNMYAIAEVYQTDVTYLKKGQIATISNPALARPITGKINEIGRLIYKNDVLGIDPSAKQDARIVEVKIEIDNSETVKNFTNLQVDIRIDISSEK